MLQVVLIFQLDYELFYLVYAFKLVALLKEDGFQTLQDDLVFFICLLQSVEEVVPSDGEFMVLVMEFGILLLELDDGSYVFLDCLLLPHQLLMLFVKVLSAGG